MQEKTIHKNQRGNASQFFVAGELVRRGLFAVVTHLAIHQILIFCVVMWREQNLFTFKSKHTCQAKIRAQWVSKQKKITEKILCGF